MGATVGMGFLGHSLPRSAIFLLQSSPQRNVAMDICFPRGLLFISVGNGHLSPERGITMGRGFSWRLVTSNKQHITRKMTSLKKKACHQEHCLTKKK
jgi:hypothetical protein